MRVYMYVYVYVYVFERKIHNVENLVCVNISHTCTSTSNMYQATREYRVPMSMLSTLEAVDISGRSLHVLTNVDEKSHEEF